MAFMPFILHAGWLRSGSALSKNRSPDEFFLLEHASSTGELVLWAEDSEFSADVQAKRTVLTKKSDTHIAVKSRQSPGGDTGKRSANSHARSSQVQSHPGQVPLSQLRQQLINQFPQSLPEHLTSLRPVSTIVWLPTLEGLPLGRRSPFQQESINSPVEGRNLESVSNKKEEALLVPWQLTGITLSALDALTFLSRLEEYQDAQRTPTFVESFRLGNDILYWGHAAKIVLEILVTQQYLPGLQMDSVGRFYALWQSCLNNDGTKERFRQLTKSMPPVCRTYALDQLQDVVSPLQLVDHFVSVLINDAIRAWIQLPTDRSSIVPSPTEEKASTYTPSSQTVHIQQPSEDTISRQVPATEWLRRLLARDNRLRLAPQPTYEFHQTWQCWIERLQITEDANVRTCFELVTPDIVESSLSLERTTVDRPMQDDQRDETSSQNILHTDWCLRYSLQVVENPQLLISARQIWQTLGEVLHVEGIRLEQPQQRLIAGLTAVQSLFLPIKRSLSCPKPETALLSTQEAHHFLREIGPLLESKGYGVIWPDWWRNRQTAQFGLRLRLSIDSALELSEHNVESLRSNRSVQFQWELGLGQRRLEQPELERLLSFHTPLLRLDGQWIELDPKQVDAALAFLNGPHETETMSFLQALFLTQYPQTQQSQNDLPSVSDLGYLGDAADLLTNGDGVGQQEDIDPTARYSGQAQSNVLDENELTSTLISMQNMVSGPLTMSTLPLDGVYAEGWLQNMLEQLRHQVRLKEIDEPTGFIGTLRPYQKRGVAWLAYLRDLGLGACLADDMGLGKTIQAIALYLHLRESHARQPLLIICPTSVLANWHREIERFAPGSRVLLHHGNNRLNGVAFQEQAPEQDFVITSYGTARRDIELLLQLTWQDLILDEAQNIKNPNAKQSLAVRRIVAHNRIALTGTPVENRLSELWSIMEFLNPGYLGSQEQFRKHYMVPIERYNHVARANNLRRLVQPFLLRQLKSDPDIISDLPEKHENVVFCTLTQEQLQLYEAVLRESILNLNRSVGIRRRGLVLNLLTQLKQICNHPAHYLKEGETLKEKDKQSGVDDLAEKLDGRSGKLNRVREMLEEALSVGDQALVFTQFVEMGALLHAYLQHKLGVEVLFLHGGTPAIQRDRMVQLFQAKDGPPIFVLSLRAGGSGLNLTRANHVFHFDRWWNPAVENQATDRAFRIGQVRNVQVHKFVVAGTLEERIHEMLEAKQSLADMIVGSGEEWLTELDTDELYNLLGS